MKQIPIQTYFFQFEQAPKYLTFHEPMTRITVSQCLLYQATFNFQSHHITGSAGAMERQNPLQKAEPFFTLPTISYIGCCQDTLRPPRACRSWRRHFFIGPVSWCCQPFHGQTAFSISYPTLPENSLHLALRTQNLTSASSRVSSTSQRLLCQLFPWESNRSF